MRESLTILAIAVILVLSALLVGPYFVDWGSQRTWLAAKLSTAMGADVRIDGPIDVKLLPRPIFRAGTVSIGGSRPHEPRFTAERLDAELSINGLLQGAVEFVDARLSGPRIELTMRPDGSLVASPLSVSSPQKVQFKRLSIEDGVVAILDEAGGERLSLNGIQAEGEAETLYGPLKLSGSAEAAQGRLGFRLTTGAFTNGRLRARLVLDRKGSWSHAEAEGQISLAAGRQGAQTVSAQFSGSFNLSGALRIAEATAPVPWSVAAASLTADPQAVAAPAIELRAGADGRALVANGGLLVGLGRDPSAVLKLKARQLDLDTLSVPPEVAPDTPRPTAAQWVAFLHGLPESGGEPSPRLSADVGIDAVTVAGVTLTDASLRLDTQPGLPPHVAASIAGPDGGRAALDGVLQAGAAPAFRGSADLATNNLATVADWLEPFWPGASAWVGQGLAGRAAGLKGQVDVSDAGVSARNASVSLGGTMFSGALSFTAAQNGARPRLVADLSADALDADQAPDLRQLAALAAPLDLSLGLRSDAIRLPRSDGGAAETGQVSLHISKKEGSIALDRFAVSGLEDASVSGSASLDSDHLLQATGRVMAKSVGPLAGLVQRLLPGSFAEALSARATALAPLELNFDAAAVLDDDGGLKPTKLSGRGTAAGTRFAGTIAPELKGGDVSRVELNLSLDAPEAARVIEQAGWRTDGQFGAVHVDLRAHGDPAAGLDSVVTASVPNAQLSFDGRIGRESGKGRLNAGGTDATAWLRLAGIERGLADRTWAGAADLSWTDQAINVARLTARLAGSALSGDLAYARTEDVPGSSAPRLTGKLAVDTAGVSALTGLALGEPRPAAQGPGMVWSGQPFGREPVVPSVGLDLRIGSLDVWPGLVGRDAAMRLSLRSGLVTLEGLTTHILGGTGGGSLSLRRNGAGASIAGKVTLDGIDLHLPALSGRVSASLDLAGTGTSPAALVGSLGGDGVVSIENATLPRLDPAALDRAAAAFNHDDAAIEEAPVRDALAKALDGGALALGAVSAPAAMAAGVVRLTVPRIAGGAAAVSADASFDLNSLALTLRTNLLALEPPPEWKGGPPQVTVTWKGPLQAPIRDIDAGAFVNGLAARAIAREQDRIELMKDDLRERAFFARRLRQIEAEQQAARDAAQIQKMVPQPPTRPGDIRLPKPPDVGPPTITPGKPAPSGAAEDGITKLLNALTPGNRTKAEPRRPMDLTPTTGPAAQATTPAPLQDPGAQGRY